MPYSKHYKYIKAGIKYSRYCYKTKAGEPDYYTNNAEGADFKRKAVTTDEKEE